MKRRSSKVHNKKKNIKETIIIFFGFLVIIFLVFSLTKAIIQRGIKKISGENNKREELTIKTTSSELGVGEKVKINSTPISFTPKKSITAVPTKKVNLSKPRPTPYRKSTPIPKKKLSVVKVATKGDFYIQVGAFKSKANADKLLASINKLGYKAVIVKANKFYKVQIPGFSTRKHALAELNRLKKKGFEGFVGRK